MDLLLLPCRTRDVSTSRKWVYVNSFIDFTWLKMCILLVNSTLDLIKIPASVGPCFSSCLQYVDGPYIYNLQKYSKYIYIHRR